jgi:hypothetical protein
MHCQLQQTDQNVKCKYKMNFNKDSLEFTKYGMFQKELYNVESLYKFIQRTCTVFELS